MKTLVRIFLFFKIIMTTDRQFHFVIPPEHVRRKTKRILMICFW